MIKDEMVNLPSRQSLRYVTNLGMPLTAKYSYHCSR